MSTVQIASSKIYMKIIKLVTELVSCR